jgi:hypothetical protein
MKKRRVGQKTMDINLEEDRESTLTAAKLNKFNDIYDYGENRPEGEEEPSVTVDENGNPVEDPEEESNPNEGSEMMSIASRSHMSQVLLKS